MKVLFAVSSESISDAIIKKYQKDYKEILSYKNVYYFNAILKEIQKDKTYDRIIISEDLEPFSNNNYDAIDKFIFEKLDNISDEAQDIDGNETSIIFICTDRHAKGSAFLVKLFSIGIYNALLGSERSMDNVCKLINKPRVKKEAKINYKIDAEDANYSNKDEKEVSELEIQNILIHFKKLGKNTEKYAESFNSISTQYTDEQLKIIINCLPINVKAVLEEDCQKYQELMSVNGIKTSRDAMVQKDAQNKTGIKIDIIENKMNQTKVTGPIVIPSSVRTSKNKSPQAVRPAGNNLDVPTTNGAETPKVKKVVRSDAQAIQPGQVAKPAQPGQAARPTQPGQVARPTQPGQIARPAQPGQAARPTQPGQIARPAQPGQAARPTQPGQVARPAQPGQAARPTQPGQVVRPAQPSQVAKAEQMKKIPPTQTPAMAAKIQAQKNGKVVAKTEGTQVESVQNNNQEEIKKKKTVIPFQNEVKEIEPTLDANENPGRDDLILPGMGNGSDFEPSLPNLDDELPRLDDNDEIGVDSLPGLDDLDDELPGLDDNLDDGLPGLDDDLGDELPGLDDNLGDELPGLDDDLGDALPGLDDNLGDELPGVDDDLGDELPGVDDDFEDELPGLGDEFEDALPGLNDDFDGGELPGLDDEGYTDEVDLPGLDELDDLNALPSIESDSVGGADDLLPGIEGNESADADLFTEVDELSDSLNSQANEIESIKPKVDYSMSSLNSLLTKDKKIVTFLGTTKNGTSFLVNNLAALFSSVEIDTAILDMTSNRNSYYIYTNNEEELRNTAFNSISKLQKGFAEGIKVNKNLTVYTSLPNDGKDYSDAEPILSTLVQNHSLILIDCDFDTDPAYFASCQEIYLVQSMDILTIQPLTAFLRDLKAKGVLESEKVRVVINKEINVKSLTTKAIIGGMSFYNDPSMSFMTELFNKDMVKACSIPFEDNVYSKYLDAMVNCKVSLNGYSKQFISKLRNLGDMVYPLVSKPAYGGKTSIPSNSLGNGKVGGLGAAKTSFSNSFSNTLSQMKKKK